MKQLLLAWSVLSAAAAAAQPVALDVSFKLTDPDYKPLPGVPVRLVFGSDPKWQEPAAGARLVTDAKGESHVTVNVVLDRRMQKKPTNFAGSLTSVKQPVDHLAIGAELEYMGYRWLYVADVVCFPDGTAMLDDFSIYTPDSQGRFTRKAVRSDQGWGMPELGGAVLTRAGYDPSNFLLVPDLAHKRATLHFGFMRYPPPVRR